MPERTATAASLIGLSADDVARLAGLYNGRLAEHGLDVRTVGWGSAADQAMRFEVLCRGINLRGARVLDIGCGLGDFVPWAEARSGSDFDYVGLDLAADLITAAQNQHRGPRRLFLADTLGPHSELGTFDLIVLSGTLTFRTTDNDATMRRLLGEAWARCRGALCVNFMSSYADHQLAKNFHYAPEAVFAHAKSLTPYVALHHDYPLYEFTAQLFRSPTLQRTAKP